MSEEFPPMNFSTLSLKDKLLLRQMINSGHGQDNVVACNLDFQKPPLNYSQKPRKTPLSLVLGKSDLDL